MNADSYQRLLHTAMDDLDLGRYSKAIKQLNKLIAADPKQPQPYFERAMALLNLDKDAEAAADLEQALLFEADYPGARDWFAGESQLKALTQEGKNDAWAVSPQKWADCASNFLEAGETQRAREVLELYLSSYESEVSAYASYATAPWRTYARILLIAGEHSRALEFAERAATASAHVPADEFIWIECLAHNGQHERAKTEMAKRDTFKGTVPYALAAKTLAERG